MRRVRPTDLLQRYRTEWPSGVTTFLGLCTFYGLVVGAVAIFQIPLPGWMIGLAAISLLAIPLAVIHFRSRFAHLPFEVISDSSDEEFTCRYSSASELREANRLTPFYGEDALEDALIEQWRLKNPKIFVGIFDKANVQVASFGVLPLTDGCLTMFVRGSITEHQFTADDILPEANMRSAKALYVSGVVVRDPKKQGLSPRRMSVMLWAMTQYIRKVYGTRTRVLYALAATSDGEKLIQRLHFQLAQTANVRTDRHNLYKLDISHEALEAVVRQVLDHRKVCLCTF